jgi:hypothetical protein
MKPYIAIVLLPLIVGTFAWNANRCAADLLLPAMTGDRSSEPAAESDLARELVRRGHPVPEALEYAKLHATFPAELSPLLQIREREGHPGLTGLFLRQVTQAHPDRRFLLILGASEAGHHGCNTEHCVTRDLARMLPAPWTPLNLTRRGQSFCETTRQLATFTEKIAPDRVAVVLTINPVFFARPGGLFPKPAPEQDKTDATRAWTAGGALIEDPDASTRGTSSFAGRLEAMLRDWFATDFTRRAIFRHRLGVAPTGPWQTNWLGPLAPALLPRADAEALRRIKVRPIDWSYYVFPGTGPTPARDWRAYHAAGRIDLDFAARRMEDLNAGRYHDCLVDLETRVAGNSIPVLLLRTPLNPGMLRLLDERDGSTRFSEIYRTYRESWRPYAARGTLPLQDLELEEADFVDLDHLAPSGHARMARKITEFFLPAFGS